jgi:glycerol-3-phosphate dehydrogenase
MHRDIGQLASREFDLLIIGGGFFGACAAWDAVLRGMTVALVEKDDFGGATSANCFKMVHGGIRYLQHADLRRLRESCFERSALLRVAPHLVHPLPIAIPTYREFRDSKFFLGAGMLVYDALTLDRNRGISDRERRIPLTTFMDRESVLRMFPDLPCDGLSGAAVFRDGQMHSPARLVLAFLQSASEHGAVIANHVEATQLSIDAGNAVKGVQAHDQLTGESFDIRSRVTLNASGPWAERLLARSGPAAGIEPGPYSRDACFVIKRRFDHDYAVAVQGRTSDPGALLSRGARHLFVVPWGDHSLVGVWHRVYDRGPDDVEVEANELESFIDEINSVYPALGLTIDDVTHYNAGLVPFGENAADAVNLEYGKESRLIDHRRTTGLDGLVTLIGIRYTMGRGDAAKAIDLVCRKLSRRVARPDTHRIPVHGGGTEHFGEFLRAAVRVSPSHLDAKIIDRLIRNHGTAYQQVLDLANEDRTLGQPLAGSAVLAAEAVHAVREEMALSLADIVFNRTELATGGHPGEPALRQCCDLAARHLGWSTADCEHELQLVRQRLAIPGQSVPVDRKAAS